MMPNLDLVLQPQDNFYPSFNVKVRTPSGVMFITFVDDSSNRLIKVIPFAGKAGLEFSIWAEGMCTLINHGLETNYLDDQKVIGLLEGFYSNRATKNNVNGPWIYSSIDGLVHAFKEYRKFKLNDLSPRTRFSPRVKLK